MARALEGGVTWGRKGQLRPLAEITSEKKENTPVLKESSGGIRAQRAGRDKQQYYIQKTFGLEPEEKSINQRIGVSRL